MLHHWYCLVKNCMKLSCCTRTLYLIFNLVSKSFLVLVWPTIELNDAFFKSFLIERLISSVEAQSLSVRLFSLHARLKKNTIDNFLIINFNECMKFQVYKYWGCSYNNIDNEIIDESAFVLVELGFQKPEPNPTIEAWFRKFKVSI